ncbi:hypothetical protein [Burkholderia arboris]|uniref:hypothetical protein n=1 Tax=Burkholderia arboris TaxID=488730 RepID=UPI001CF5CD4B|nr:hypothetical protein [Burkholderia arboris]MCA8051314.1 hypothetical protein [Burkholderia arboris]
MANAYFTGQDSPNCKSKIDVLDHPDSVIGRKSAQLHALLTSMYGEGFDSFNSLNGQLKDSLLWLAADLAESIERASRGEVAIYTEVRHG